MVMTTTKRRRTEDEECSERMITAEPKANVFIA
jgi:hypothetical protein